MRTKSQKFHVFLTFFAIFAMFFCVFSFFTNFSYVNASSSSYIVSANSAIVFEEPDLASTQISTLAHKEEVSLEMSGNLAKVYSGTGTSTDYEFYHITNSGYVLCDLVTLKTSQITQLPSFNAQTNTDAVVYEVSAPNFVATSTTLTQGTRIYLYEGYDESLAMTAICYVINDEVCYGYILTSAIAPDGISSTVITCTIIIIALLGIIFAWLFIKNRQRKIKKEGKKALKEQKKQKKAEDKKKKEEKKAKKLEKKLKKQEISEIPTENG